MPELAEVEYYRKRWSPHIGERVDSLHVHAEKRLFRDVDISLFEKQMPELKFSEALAHGKQMLFRFGQSTWLGVHLGMTGRLETALSSDPIGKHEHLCIDLNSGDRLVFTDSRIFGRVRFDQSESVPDWWATLPPQILEDAFTFEYVDAFLSRRKGAPVKAVLLMQEVFPGVGNWMADEILWRCQIQPRVVAGAISRGKRLALFKSIREVAKDALRVIGTDWSDPPDSWLFNHRWRDGGICPKTGCDLVREAIGGRTTCWSPEWQVYHGG